MSYKAIHRYARISAQKVRPFANLVRNQFAEDAMDTLKYHPNRGARMLEKVIQSAIHNAEDRRVSDLSSLLITDVRIDGGPNTIKRMRPKSRGMASVITRMVSHISVTLEDVNESSDESEGEEQ